MTLVTGDRVSVVGNDIHTRMITPGTGRDQVRFISTETGGHLSVIPQDALAMVEDGRLDRRLFDVTGLLKLGYDDAHRDTLPLIVGYRSGTARRSAAVASAGVTQTRSLPAINGTAMREGKAQAGSVWSSLVTGAGGTHATLTDGVARVWLDGVRRVADDVSTPQIGAPTAWKAGYSGTGIGVAVLDTGVDASHPDLAGRIAAQQNFTDDPDLADKVGHGTHVASIIAGSGAASDGRYVGVAPQADLYVGKVCATSECPDSAILAGMQWAASEVHARVVNLSLGEGDTADVDPLEEAVQTLSAQYGTLFVVAAGNDGPGDSTVGSPASADAALAVGAVDSHEALADFSSRGPRIVDDALKPDITAPGVNIVAARATDTLMGDPVGDSYVSASGTSMATPHVAGAAALLAQQHPDWTGAQLKAALMASAAPNPSLTGYQQGAGRVDVGRALSQPVTSDPASLSLGRQDWPHTDDKPIVRTLTYRNSGASALTLRLRASVLGPDGKAAPDGMFTFDPETVTVPAGGTAQVSVTADTRVAGPDGRYSGQVLATAGDSQVSTPIGLNRDIDAYDLTIKSIDRTGQPASAYLPRVYSLDDGSVYIPPFSTTGTVTARVPKGRYQVLVVVLRELRPDYDEMTMMVDASLAVDRNATVTFDARQAGPITQTVPEPSVESTAIEVGFTHFGKVGQYSTNMSGGHFDDLYIGNIGAPAPKGEFVGYVQSQWIKRNPAGQPFWYSDSLVNYNVAAFMDGTLPNGYHRDFQPKDLSVTQAAFGRVQAGDVGWRTTTAHGPRNITIASPLLPLTLPATRTEYHNTDQVSWSAYLLLSSSPYVPTPNGVLTVTPIAYRAGHHYREQWNEAPFGPTMAFGPDSYMKNHFSRKGDRIRINPPLFGDGAGHYGAWMNHNGMVTTLSRDGTPIAQAQWGYLETDLPADPARYTVAVESRRSGYTDLATSVRATWTFRSGHTPTDTDTLLPVLAVRFKPVLKDSAAPAGQEAQIPVTVESQTGQAPQARVTGVQVSYDDGATWQPAPLHRGLAGSFVTVHHPATTGYVSLRATATDPAGNTVDQTVIHAYRLGTAG